MREYRTVKIWVSTYRLLKVLAAQSGETLAALVDRLAQEERKRQTKEAQ